LTVFNTAVIIAGPFATCTLYIVKQVGGRGMYSFLHVSGRYCAATNPGEWLQMAGLHQKGSGYHNSGVVELKLEDFKPFAKYGALAGMEFKV
jgi:hypothetical protein